MALMDKLNLVLGLKAYNVQSQTEFLQIPFSYTKVMNIECTFDNIKTFRINYAMWIIHYCFI